MNDKEINGKILIEDDNYILSFKVTKDISVNPPIIVTYAVSVEEKEAYSTECQITFNFKDCYHSCEKCSKDITESSAEEHNCINCKDNFYQSPENNYNCFSIEEKKINWYFDSKIISLVFVKMNALVHAQAQIQMTAFFVLIK